jgi:hypothetical protein
MILPSSRGTCGLAYAMFAPDIISVYLAITEEGLHLEFWVFILLVTFYSG